MECYCEPMEVDECCDVWQVSWRIARKQHICCECGEKINPGERYERIFSVHEEGVQTFKTCEFCTAELDRLKEKHPDVQFAKTDLACILVWDMRNEVAYSAEKEKAGRKGDGG